MPIASFVRVTSDRPVQRSGDERPRRHTRKPLLVRGDGTSAPHAVGTPPAPSRERRFPVRLREEARKPSPFVVSEGKPTGFSRGSVTTAMTRARGS